MSSQEPAKPVPAPEPRSEDAQPSAGTARLGMTSRLLFLLVLAILVSLLFLGVIRGFLLTLAMAAVLASVSMPLYRWLARRLGGREGIAAGLTILVLIVVVVAPGMFFLSVLWDDAVEIRDRVVPWVQEQLKDPSKLEQSLAESPLLKKLVPYQDKILEKAGKIAGKAASFVADAVVAGAAGVASFLLMLFVALYGTYFFLRQGGATAEAAFALTPLNAADKERLVETFTSVSRATLKGTLVVGIVQGGLAGAAFAVVGIQGAVFWAAVMAVLSVLPGIGSALIWVPAVAYFAINGQVGAAVGLGAWCALVVGTIDNVLRPSLVGKDTKMPDILVLLTTLGGLALFGIAGIVLGPLVGALFLSVWGLWGAATRQETE